MFRKFCSSFLLLFFPFWRMNRPNRIGILGTLSVVLSFYFFSIVFFKVNSNLCSSYRTFIDFFRFSFIFHNFFFIHATATRFTTMHSSVLPEQRTYLSYGPFPILRSHCYSFFVWFCVHRHCNKNKAKPFIT